MQKSRKSLDTSISPLWGAQEGLVSILGCGWLGLPLGKQLVQMGNSVKGSTTSSSKMEILSSEGILPYLISISPEGILGDIAAFLAETDILIINIPPGLRKNPNSDFVGRMKGLMDEVEASGIKKVLFVSSISVYRDTGAFPTYSADDEPNGISGTATQMISAEKMFSSNRHFQTCILRLGGLIGGERHPIRQLSGRKNIRDPKAPVNLVHREDCISIMVEILKNNHFGKVFNAVFPWHPKKKDYYIQKAEEQELLAPEFDESTPSEGKIIDSSALVESLDFVFQKKI